jgi:hypothetical protein
MFTSCFYYCPYLENVGTEYSQWGSKQYVGDPKIFGYISMGLSLYVEVSAPSDQITNSTEIHLFDMTIIELLHPLFVEIQQFTFCLNAKHATNFIQLVLF